MSGNGGALEEARVPLIDDLASTEKYYENGPLRERVWIEPKKLWRIVGPAIFNRLASYSILVITQVFTGHLGDLELAAISIANNVIVGFNFGLSPKDVAELSGMVAIWMIPLHFSFALQFPLQRFLQCQLKNMVTAWVSLVALAVHGIVSWVLVYRFRVGVVGTVVSMNFSWWVLVFGHLGYTVCGGCPSTWTGFSMEAFSGLWEFIKLSAAAGVMLCLENWYYRILILMTGNLENAKIAVDALSICMTINGWEMMIPLAFFAGTGVRVANELGAGNGKGAKFATTVSVVTSILIGIFFWLLIMILHDKFALIFSASDPVLKAVTNLSFLLAFTVLLNSVQPILSGVAVGCGWQSYVAYINLGCYYLIGVPLWGFHLGVMGIWGGMIFGGTAIQTLILALITLRCDWQKEAEKANLLLQKWSEV
ncbi:hypothetical protein GOBAR_AA04839 [Gossypium barbadense]|uniref:Protein DETOXIFICATION n=1 Tax=Gossypium barbadense TaxID=3634 RepID=A0A2P5YJG2_GOSBA|nr:hypothetical protein GOBAR_AA04839 [Gossypium barbadense]